VFSWGHINESMRDDQGSSYAFNGSRQSLQQLPVVVQLHGLHVSFGTDLLGHCGSLVVVPTTLRASIIGGCRHLYIYQSFQTVSGAHLKSCPMGKGKGHPRTGHADTGGE
jgi:hypothetical protein